MIQWMAAGFLVAGFVVLAKAFKLLEKSREVVDLSRCSVNILRNAALDDNAKEKAMREHSGRLFALAFSLAIGATAAVFLPAAMVWLCDRLGWISFTAVCDVALSPAFIAVSGVLVLAVFVASWKFKRSAKANDVVAADNYSTLERVLHRVAFKTGPAQLALADAEDRLFAKQLANCRADRPVFVTALPRAGTTMLLELCAKMSEFASHCYRDMPFVLIPCLWNRFSVAFRRNTALRERAHGDGMLIDFDSPEALEEVLWKAFWRRHYQPDRIVPWRIDDPKEDAEEFQEFFRRHMRKIVFVRRGQDSHGVRYLSKNNLNVARTPLLRKLFPDAIIVVPFRDPFQHAQSLLKQHLNFLRIHKEDRFASEYMRAIGHYDFGENLRPVDFDGWFDRRESKQPDGLAFWLEYWAAGYRHLLENDADLLRFIDYDALCENPQRGLSLLADAVDCREPDALLAAAPGIHPAKPRTVDLAGVSASILHEVNRVHAGLKRQAEARSPEI